MSDDDSLRVLIALAKKMPHAESARRDAASFADFEARLTRSGFGSRADPRASTAHKRTRVILALSALTTCGALLFAWPPLRGAVFDPTGPELSYRVRSLSAACSSAGPCTPTSVWHTDGDSAGHKDGERAAQELSFSDGSRVLLEQESEADVSALTRHGARVELAHGRAEVSIAKRKNAAWQMIAGPYTVRVTGTAFRLAWSRERQELEIAMHHGSVIVTGPMAEQGVPLGAGQRLTGSPRARRLLVEDWQPKPELTPVPTAPAAIAAAELPAAEASEVVVMVRERARGASQVLLARGTARFDPGRAAAPSSAEHGWANKVAQGDFSVVLREARVLGFSRVLLSATAEDLGALADAARYAREDALGQKALLALRQRFPASRPARDSAFLLGRLSREKSALSWYQRYLDEQPNGAYVSQALGRSMMLCYELGDATRAKQLARTYLTRFASGPYAASARKLGATVRADTATP